MSDRKTSHNFENFEVFGVQGTILSIEQLHEEIERLIASDLKSLILNVNVHGLNLAYTTPWLRDFWNESHIVFCDGVGVILGASILGYRIPVRITYADWMWQFAAFAESKQYSMYFLGAKPGIVEAAAKNLTETFPNLKIAGTHHGYFDKSLGSVDNESVILDINNCKPDVLLVGFGMPMQEQWLMENWNRIEAVIALTGGAVFDYLSGNLRRAPRWMTDHGLEWLGRLIIEPHRLWKRYIVGIPLFIWRIIKQRLTNHRP